MSEEVAVVEEEVLDEPAEQVEDSQEAPPAEEPKNQDKPEISEEAEQYMNAKIGDYAFKKREAERQAQEEKRLREEAQARLAEYEKATRPNIPPAPDPFDDNYEEKIQARDEAILNAAKYDAEQEVIARNAQEAEAQRQQQAQAELVQRAKTYSGRAEKLGIRPEELQVAGNAIAQYGIQDDVAGFILDDEQGPAITMYLSKNPLEIETVRNMEPMRAAIYIETSVKQKAIASRPKVDTAPPPIETPTGVAMGETNDLPGATFE